jgi:integrase
LLKVEDVDLETGKLTIRQSKGNKDRNVMLSEEVLDLCRIYHAKVSRIFPDRVGFFPNQCGNFITISAGLTLLVPSFLEQNRDHEQQQRKSASCP